ncbi:MAG: ATP phosphoribosyltransferase regulatory subunit [Nanoarchaeota archaeon]
METVKGFKDIEDSSKRITIRNVIENIFKLYNFKPVETPIIEYEEFVKGENINDEAVSSIFKLEDRRKRKLALRYEFTFQLKRLAQNKKLPYKRYQIGNIFRYEPVTINRWREFTQCDVDVVGSNFKDEAEILKITSEILKKLKIKFTINVNNRKLLDEILDEFKVLDKNKNQTIREIDKLDKLPEKDVFNSLKKLGAEKVLSIFKKPEKYFAKYNGYKEIKKLKEACRLYNVKVNFQPFLARGLTYYNGSVFEVKPVDKPKEMKDTIVSGGSYLVNGIQSTGISFGLDRLELLAKIKIPDKKVLIISLNQDKKAVLLADKIRNLKVPCQIFYGKPTKALDYANSYSIPIVIFIGEEEVKKKKFKLKNMTTGKEKLLSEKDLLESLS